MKIEIEIDEETAALVWANRTWEGREKYTMAEIVKDLAEEEAAKYRNTFPKAVARVVREYAALANTPDQTVSPNPKKI